MTGFERKDNLYIHNLKKNIEKAYGEIRRTDSKVTKDNVKTALRSDLETFTDL